VVGRIERAAHYGKSRRSDIRTRARRTKRNDFSVAKSVKSLKDYSKFRARLMRIEECASAKYFDQVLGLIPESVRPELRKTLKAYDGVNNIFN